ncbi:hypothetical protein M5W83_01110 [Paenibacillus thiaminolyticus]|uniref:Uncharacterized protein n=1 Tax=Paenibacillus thiaminolyticus TaxID=49283 RepID=A0AAP9DYA9_PANTH|nr:hypothetical protein [Paenibacillus thiaminolyticus]MCY9536112.1 hypothetical protein [Paenibacillus thiaminolyticus]MCY9605495.1 hypothetical protein [Paenibacillus thiaminolyticus]MCY9605780.1 hypothetical protein [Paenibacillus thiaminolyticus]MCY9611719.1 hypothetical protein [Paenibacillus thiaminolyticus]MCY9621590.1 hypothetical protein [Paenibacillus thiaminolyticus]
MRQPHPAFHSLRLFAEKLQKTAKLQFSLMIFTLLQEFLQNCINFSHANGLKAKNGEKDALFRPLEPPFFYEGVEMSM